MKRPTDAPRILSFAHKPKPTPVRPASPPDRIRPGGLRIKVTVERPAPPNVHDEDGKALFE